MSSYSAAGYAAGFANNGTGVSFEPGPRHEAEQINIVNSLGEIVVGSTHAFVIDIGHRGIVRKVEVSNESLDLWTLHFYSGSAAVTSEHLFESKSLATGSLFFLDQALFPYENTDVASPGMIFGRVDARSGAGVGSGHFNVSVWAERFR